MKVDKNHRDEMLSALGLTIKATTVYMTSDGRVSDDETEAWGHEAFLDFKRKLEDSLSSSTVEDIIDNLRPVLDAAREYLELAETLK